MISIKDSNITINVKDFDAAIAFYQSIGFALKQRWGNHYAQLAATGITIGLHPKSDGEVMGSGNVSVGFTIADFENAGAVLKSLQIETVERTEEGGQFIHFKDLDGTALYFIKPKW